MAFNPEVETKSAMTAELRKAGYSLVDAAEEFGVPYQHLANVARNRTHARQEVIDGFKELTGKRLAKYVAPWVVAKPYQPAQSTK